MRARRGVRFFARRACARGGAPSPPTPATRGGGGASPVPPGVGDMPPGACMARAFLVASSQRPAVKGIETQCFLKGVTESFLFPSPPRPRRRARAVRRTPPVCTAVRRGDVFCRAGRRSPRIVAAANAAANAAVAASAASAAPAPSGTPQTARWAGSSAARAERRGGAAVAAVTAVGAQSALPCSALLRSDCAARSTDGQRSSVSNPAAMRSQSRREVTVRT